MRGNMKTPWTILSLFAATSTAVVAALVPDTITLTWAREDVDAAGDTNSAAVYLTGITYRMTNCQALVSAAISTNVASVTQDLTGLTITVRCGDERTNAAYAGHIQDATNGTFSADVSFPRWPLGPSRAATAVMGIQLTLADTNANTTMTYKARKTFTLRQPLY